MKILNLLVDNSRMTEFDDMFDFGTVRYTTFNIVHHELLCCYNFFFYNDLFHSYIFFNYFCYN